MARQSLAVQRLTSAGIIPTWSTPVVVDGFKISNDGDTHIHIKNGGAVLLTVTITTPSTFDGLAVADRTVTIAAGAEKEFVLPIGYNQPDSSADAGQVYMDFDVATSILVKATHR